MNDYTAFKGLQGEIPGASSQLGGECIISVRDGYEELFSRVITRLMCSPFTYLEDKAP
jgi:hypothetical protein